MRRFSKRVQESGTMIQVRKIRFHSKSPNKGALKNKALRRLELTTKRNWLIKSGRLVEEERGSFQRKRS